MIKWVFLSYFLLSLYGLKCFILLICELHARILFFKPSEFLYDKLTISHDELSENKIGIKLEFGFVFSKIF